MAKVSAVAKNNRREKLIKKYAEKRAELKGIISDKKVLIKISSKLSLNYLSYQEMALKLDIETGVTSLVDQEDFIETLEYPG